MVHMIVIIILIVEDINTIECGRLSHTVFQRHVQHFGSYHPTLNSPNKPNMVDIPDEC